MRILKKRKKERRGCQMAALSVRELSALCVVIYWAFYSACSLCCHNASDFCIPGLPIKLLPHLSLFCPDLEDWLILGTFRVSHNVCNPHPHTAFWLPCCASEVILLFKLTASAAQQTLL